MPAYTVGEAAAELAFWKAALAASSKGESLSWNSRTITPQSPEECRGMITYFQRIVDSTGKPGYSTSIADFSNSD